MPFVEHDQAIQTLPADGADHPFAVRILPGRGRRHEDFLDAHAFDSLFEVVTIDVITIADQKTWSRLVEEGLDDLLGGPFGVRIRGDAEVNHAPPIMAEHQEPVEDAKRDRGNGEEVAGGDLGNVIGQECPPRRLSPA
jgi:hypothetical protein